MAFPDSANARAEMAAAREEAGESSLLLGAEIEAARKEARGRGYARRSSSGDRRKRCSTRGGRGDDGSDA